MGEEIGLALSSFDRAHPDYEGMLEEARSRLGDDAALKVELDGSSAGSSAIGLDMITSNSMIRGLAANDFDADGILVEGALSTGNRIEGNGGEVSRNSVYSNGGLGIDLQGTGEHFFTNVSAPNTKVADTSNSSAKETFVVRFSANPAGGDEGKKFLGKLFVSTDLKGNTTFAKSLASVPVCNP